MSLALIMGEMISIFWGYSGDVLLLISILLVISVLIFAMGYARGLFVVSKYELVILGICLAMLVVGGLRGSYVNKIYDKYDKLQYGEQTEYVQMLGGAVVDIKSNTYGYTITIKVEDGFVYVYAKGNLLEGEEDRIYSFLYGKNIRVNGDIVPMKTARNYGNYDEYTTLRSKGVILKISADDIFVESENGYMAVETIFTSTGGNRRNTLTAKGLLSNLKVKLRSILKSITTEEEYGILAAMVLGDSEEVDKEIKEIYSLSGISHIMAISGLHISLIGMGVYKLLRKRMRYISSATISMGIMSLFLVFIGNPISATRAVIMFIVHMIADLSGRKYDMLSALSLAAIVLLIDNPYCLVNASFQLSFAAMIAVSVCAPIVMEFFEKCRVLHLNTDIYNKMEVDKNDGKNKIGNQQIVWVKMLIAASIKMLVFNMVLSITLMPLNCYLFFRYSTYSFFVNIIVVPLVSVVLVMTLLGMLVAICFPTGGIFLIGAAVYILRFFTWLSQRIVTLPYASVVTGKLSLKEVALCYIILVVCLFVLFDKTGWSLRKAKVKGNSIKIFTVLCMMSIFFIIVFRSKYDSFTICFLDVGQGASIYIKSENGNDYLIDGGSSDEKNIGEYKLESFLEARQVDKLEYVFVTHCDTDHISGIEELIVRGNIAIDNLVLPDISKEAREEKYLELEAMAKAQGIKVLHMKSGDMIRDGELKLSCINPCVAGDASYDTYVSQVETQTEIQGRSNTTDINENSLVMVAEYKSLVAVFTGDIGKKTEQDLVCFLEKFDLRDKLVIYDVAHHGSGNSNSEEFIELLKPRVSVISCGKDNSYGHPADEVLERLDKVGSDVWVTYECGQIEVYEDEGRICVRGYITE